MLRYFTLLVSIVFLAGVQQSQAQVKWYNPEEATVDQVQGQAFKGQERESFYHRFPMKARQTVRNHVWGLSKSTAGESILFSTDSKSIKVRYKVAGGFEMHHMPATGVSGVDLYTNDRDGDEIWLAARCSFRDTVTFEYNDIDIQEPVAGSQRYTLFLPLYNEVTWMEIGVDEGADFRFEPAPQGKTIVAYGTSIAQGACASRPGMAWSNILQRMLGREVVNLGFSGNALMENEVIDLLAEIDAEVYLIDAMPNVCSFEAQAIKDTVLTSIRRLRSLKPDTPIVLVDHLGYPHARANSKARVKEDNALKMQRLAYEQLKKEGMKDLYYLSYDEIALPQDATVEGSHVSDYGMMVYAEAYRKKLRKILK